MNGFNTKPEGGRVQGWALYTEGVKLILGCGSDVGQLFICCTLVQLVKLQKKKFRINIMHALLTHTGVKMKWSICNLLISYYSSVWGQLDFFKLNFYLARIH